VALQTAQSGATWGTIGNPGSLLRGAEQLIKTAGAEAIAVVARFPDDVDSDALHNYRQGQGVDPLAGAEAVISHLIVRTFQIPCAHAPALAPLALDPTISPKSAAEELGHTFLPCVLVGLSRAPQFIVGAGLRPTDVGSSQVDALIVPESACGGSAVLSLSQTRTRIIAVADNLTRMQVPPAALGIDAITVSSYLEAIGSLVAHRAGLDPLALRAQVLPLSAARSETIGRSAVFPTPIFV
jgi:Protein of unknown function (DUF3326)